MNCTWSSITIRIPNSISHSLWFPARSFGTSPLHESSRTAIPSQTLCLFPNYDLLSPSIRRPSHNLEQPPVNGHIYTPELCPSCWPSTSSTSFLVAVSFPCLKTIQTWHWVAKIFALPFPYVHDDPSWSWRTPPKEYRHSTLSFCLFFCYIHQAF